MSAPTTDDIRNIVKAAATFSAHAGLNLGIEGIMRGFDTWLLKHDQTMKAEAWDEAIEAQLETQSAVRGITIQIAPNPYREEIE